MKKILSFLLVLTAAVAVNAATVIDELTTSSFKIPGKKDSPYALFSATGASGAEYKVFAYGTNGKNIQVNTKKNGIGIVTTASNKYVKSVTITMGQDDKEYATSIYASNTAYADPADLKTATKIAEVSTTKTVTYTFTENYKYVGIAPTSGAAYYASVKIEWSDEKVGIDPVEWVPDTIQVSNIARLVGSGDVHSHYIVGIVDGDPWINFSTGCMWLRDINNPQDSVEGFKIDNADLKAFTEETLAATIGAGDTILIFAQSVATYTDQKTNHTYYETTSGHYVKTLGKNANRQFITLVSGTATYDTEESLISFTFRNEKGDMTLSLDEADHEDAQSIAGAYIVSDFAKATIGNDLLSEGRLTLTMTNIDAAGVVSYNVVFASNNYKCTGTNIPLGKFAGDNNNISVAKAMQIGNALENNAGTEKTYNIYGYVAKIDKKTKGWKKENPIQTFYMTDKKGGTYGDFECYNTTVNVDNAADTLKAGDFVCVTTVIKKYVGDKGYVTIETSGKSTAVKLDPKDAPNITGVTAIEICTSEALTIGHNMAVGATAEVYSVGGYIVKDPKVEGTNIYTVFMSDDKNDTYGEFEGYKCTCDIALQKGDYIRVEGPITRYDGKDSKGKEYTSIEISKGKITRVWAAAIDATETSVKAVKTLHNDQIMIERNGVTYTIMGNKIQ